MTLKLSLGYLFPGLYPNHDVRLAPPAMTIILTMTVLPLATSYWWNQVFLTWGIFYLPRWLSFNDCEILYQTGKSNILSRFSPFWLKRTDIDIKNLTSFLDDFLINVFHPQLDEALTELSAHIFIELDAFQQDPQSAHIAKKPIFKVRLTQLRRKAHMD